MRFDKKVFFVSSDREYDPNTGDYYGEVERSTERWADVTDASETTLRLVYGEIRQGAVVVRLGDRFTEPFDSIVIDGAYYGVDYRRRLLRRDVFVCTQRQGTGGASV